MRRIKRIKHLEKQVEIMGRNVYALEREINTYKYLRNNLDSIWGILYKDYPVPTGLAPELKDQFK